MSECDAGRLGDSRAGDVAVAVVGIFLAGLIAIVAIGTARSLGGW